MERVVSGPCQIRGPKFGCYEVKWQGYGSDENTWEPLHHLPIREVLKYDVLKDATDSDDDDVPIASQLGKPTFSV
jgi:hypothetical protein